MNIEKIYKQLKELEVNESQKDILNEILKELEVEIITNGKINKSILSTAKRIFKDMKGRPTFSQIYETQKGNYCICNGYALIDYGKNKDNIPKELQPYININEYIKPTTDMETLKNTNLEKTGDLKITDLEKICKYNKAQKEDKIFYVLDNEIMFNVETMLDFIKLSGIIVNEITIEYGNPKEPINMIFENENINAMILPVFNEKIKEQNISKFNEIMEV